MNDNVAMSNTWPAGRAMLTPDEVIEALDLDDLDDLADHLENRLVDVGPLHWTWEITDNCLTATLSNGYVGALLFDLPLPLTLAEFESALDDLDQRLEFRSAAAELPGLDSIEDEGDVVATTGALAQFFGVTLWEFVDVLCGDWRPVDGTLLTGRNEVPLRWFGAGSPLQVLLGIGEDYATLARPVEFHGGLAGPPTLEADDHVDIELRRGRRTLAELADELPPILASSRDDWDYCRGCLNFGPLGVSGRYCGACQYTYLGLIVD